MPQSTRWPCLIVLMASFLAACLSMPTAVEAQLRAKAVLGEPFGVGRVEVTLSEPTLPEPLGPAGLGLSEANGRALYPAVDSGEMGAVLKGMKEVLDQSERPVGRLLGELLKPPPKATVYFLFQGDAPLELTLQSRRADALRVTPTADPAEYRRLMRAWWRHYTGSPGLLAEALHKPDYPPQVESYLEAMLGYRLGLRLPEQRGGESFQDQLEGELGLLMGTDSIRVAIQRDRFLGRTALNEAADQPLPEPVAVPELQVPDPPKEVAIEPLATRVPAECLYVRFGSFSNFLWIQDMLATWGGDMQNLIALRGLDYRASSRIEDSLVLKQSALARLVGPTAIADVAIIGTDLFFQEGGAFGLLFQARNNFLLTADFKRQRSERLKKDDGVTEATITIDGHQVSLLSAPDGSVRSFYAADGGFHFVTRSQTLMQRFLETGSGEGALGTSQEFRHARSLMPLDRDDTVFFYASDAFFRNYVGPQYRVEAVRRMQAMADVELVQLAVLASAAEGKPGDTIEELIGGGFLPPDFGIRPDGSRAVLEDGEVYDSLRGRRGAFLPVPDVPIDRASPSEADAYRQFCDFYRSHWGRLDPIVGGIQRQAIEGGRERIVFDVRMTPFASENYQRLQEKFGPPDSVRLAPIPGDAIAAEAVLTDQRLFGALRQIRLPSPEWLQQGILRSFRDLLVGYAGAVGELGPLQWLNVRIPDASDAAGYASGPGGMWRRQSGQFTVFSFQPEVLAEVTPQLRFEEAERPAQIRLRVEDVSQAPITPVVNNLGYARTRETSLGNLRLMHQLDQQLHVPPEHCKEAAELLLDAILICPLGGEYVYREIPGGSGFWTSTALVDHPSGGLFSTQAPEGFVAPPLNWFRGLKADVLVTPEALSAHAELIMQMPQKGSAENEDG